MTATIAGAVDCVVVRIAERRVAVPTSRVREVAALGNVTPVPTAPPTVAGVTQLRGQILPVLDLQPGWGLQPHAARPADPLLVVEWGPSRAALLVDHVIGVEADPPAGERLDVAALFDSLRATLGPA